MFKTLCYRFNRYSKAHEHLTHFAVITLTFIFFFTFDFLSKLFLFTFDKSKQGIGISFIVIGIRSYAHANTTLISFLNIKIDPLFLGVFAITLFSLLFLLSLKLKRKINIFWIMIIASGVLGNGIDFLRFGYVRDIIYLPWFDRGTFNLADVLIVVGASGLALTIFINEVIRESHFESII